MFKITQQPSTKWMGWSNTLRLQMSFLYRHEILERFVVWNPWKVSIFQLEIYDTDRYQNSKKKSQPHRVRFLIITPLLLLSNSGRSSDCPSVKTNIHKREIMHKPSKRKSRAPRKTTLTLRCQNCKRHRSRRYHRLHEIDPWTFPSKGNCSRTWCRDLPFTIPELE